MASNWQDQFIKNVSDWSELNDYQMKLKHSDDEEARIILTNQSKQYSTIVIDYDIHEFDECLIIEYQSYSYRVTNKYTILSSALFLTSVLDALAANKFKLIVSHYNNKLIDSSIIISIGEQEVMLTGPSTVVGESRFRIFQLNIYASK